MKKYSLLLGLAAGVVSLGLSTGSALAGYCCVQGTPTMQNYWHTNSQDVTGPKQTIACYPKACWSWTNGNCSSYGPGWINDPSGTNVNCNKQPITDGYADPGYCNGRQEAAACPGQ